MCMEDFRIGRRLKVRRKSLILESSSPYTVLGDSNRTHVRFAAEPGLALRVFAGDYMNVNFLGEVTNEVGMMEFDVREYGDLLMGSFTLLANSATGMVSIIESLLEEQ